MSRVYRIYHPEVFQGSIKQSNYFEGWYFKLVSADCSGAVAFIPGISLSDDRHAFVQYIDGVNRRTAYFRYPVEEFSYDRRRFMVRIGESTFTRSSASVNLNDAKWKISGEVHFKGQISLPKSILQPGIMGWYSFVPRMECNHGVVSIDHLIEGSVSVNGSVTGFTGGRGYIEKDWGVSFPESWIWLQCNNFEVAGVSLMVSVAKIPWRGRFFMGLIAFLHINGATELFATYNGAVVDSLVQVNPNLTEIIIRKRRKMLSVRVHKSGSGSIVAPVNGKMTKMIRESISSEVEFVYSDGYGREITMRGVRAGYEEMEKIFEYFRK